MIGHRQQRVDIRRQIDARHFRVLVDHHVEEAGVLVGEAIVILAPDGGGDEQIDGSNRRAPGNLFADGQPLGVLVVHGIDDVHEGLVGGEETVPAAQHIAFRPAFQRVLGQHFQHPAVG